MRTPLYALPMVLLLVGAPARAQAQQAAADALFDSARAAMAKGALDEACEKFHESDLLDPAPGTELNLADCEEKRGRLASAWVLFRTGEEKLAENDERLPVAHARAQALQPRVPKLMLSLEADAPKNCRVKDGAVDFGSAAFGVPLPVEPGPHELVVSAPGFEPRLFRVLLVPGEVRALVVSPGARASAATPAAPEAARAATHEEPAPSNGKRTLGFTLSGLGVAGFGVGTIAGALMLSQKHTVATECQPDKSCTAAGLDAAHSASSLQTVSNIGWVVGGAALGAGVYLLLSSGGSAKASTSLAVATTPAGGRLSLSRSW